MTAMSLLRYVKVISKPSDASSSSGSHAEGSSTDHDGQFHGARGDDSAEDSGPSPLKRAKTVSHTLDSKLSASEVTTHDSHTNCPMGSGSSKHS